MRPSTALTPYREELFSMIDRIVLKGVLLSYLITRKDPPSRAPLHFEPIDFMIVPDQKMGEKMPIHLRNYNRDQRNCLAII